MSYIRVTINTIDGHKIKGLYRVLKSDALPERTIPFDILSIEPPLGRDIFWPQRHYQEILRLAKLEARKLIDNP